MNHKINIHLNFFFIENIYEAKKHFIIKKLDNILLKSYG